MRRLSGAASTEIVELDIEFHPAHARKIVLARVEEHPPEQLRRRFESRRVTGAKLAVDVDQRVLLRLDRIFLERVGDHDPTLVALGKEYVERPNPGFK